MKIVDPKTMKKHKLFSRKGLKIFEDYLNYFKKNERRVRIKALKMDMEKMIMLQKWSPIIQAMSRYGED